MSDFVGGIAARRVAVLRVLAVSYPVGCVLLGVAALGTGGAISRGAEVWGTLCGISVAFGGWWLYVALASGPISVVAPVAAVLTAVLPVGVGIALGEWPAAPGALGIALALAAVILVSREVPDKDVRPHRFTAKVAWLTVASGVAWLTVASGVAWGRRIPAVATGARPDRRQRIGHRPGRGERRSAIAGRDAAEAGTGRWRRWYYVSG